jgi:hypothetical protein
MALQQPDFAKMPCLAVDFNDKDLLGVEMLQTFGVTCQKFTAVLLGSPKGTDGMPGDHGKVAGFQ